MTAWCRCVAVERDLHGQKINIATKFDPSEGPNSSSNPKQRKKSDVWRVLQNIKSFSKTYLYNPFDGERNGDAVKELSPIWCRS